MPLANSSTADLLAHVESAILISSQERQAEIAGRITLLFLSAGGHYSEEQIALFSGVFERLIDKIETRTLIDLAEKLSNAPRAPARVMQRLASHDDLYVASPVLRNSAELTDEDLINIGTTKTQGHMLAISQRKTLSEPVTDVLVARGDDAVAQMVTVNSGARFSEPTLETLFSRAQDCEALAPGLAARNDIPPHIFCRLLVQASEAVRTRVIAAARPEWRERINTILDRIAGQLADESPGKRGLTRRRGACCSSTPTATSRNRTCWPCASPAGPTTSLPDSR